MWWDGTRVPLRRFAPGMPLGGTTGAMEAMALWAGESVGGVTQVQPAADIVRELATAPSACCAAGPGGARLTPAGVCCSANICSLCALIVQRLLTECDGLGRTLQEDIPEQRGKDELMRQRAPAAN
jgi:hypothetical protein